MSGPLQVILGVAVLGWILHDQATGAAVLAAPAAHRGGPGDHWPRRDRLRAATHPVSLLGVQGLVTMRRAEALRGAPVLAGVRS